MTAAPVITSLRDRGLAEKRATEESKRAELAAERAKIIERDKTRLVERLVQAFGIAIPLDDLIVAGDEGDVRVVIDGDLTFALRDRPYAAYVDDRDVPHVLVPCSAGCGKELWAEAPDLYALGWALTTPQQHPAPCIKRPTPARRAELSVADVEIVAAELTEALRTEHKALVDRDKLLARTVASMLGQPNPLTPGKPYTQTAAEAAAKLSDEYLALQEVRVEAECYRILLESKLEAAKLSARLTVNTLRVD